MSAISDLDERDRRDRTAVLGVMATTQPTRCSTGSFTSFVVGCRAWSNLPPGIAQSRAVRALKGLRREGLTECLGTNGLWRLTKAARAAGVEVREIASSPAGEAEQQA